MKKIKEEQLGSQGFMAVATVIQYEIKKVLESFASTPISCQAALVETLMEMIIQNENPAKCFNIISFIMDLRMRKRLRNND